MQAGTLQTEKQDNAWNLTLKSTSLENVLLTVTKLRRKWQHFCLLSWQTREALTFRHFKINIVHFHSCVQILRHYSPFSNKHNVQEGKIEAQVKIWGWRTQAVTGTGNHKPILGTRGGIQKSVQGTCEHWRWVQEAVNISEAHQAGLLKCERTESCHEECRAVTWAYDWRSLFPIIIFMLKCCRKRSPWMEEGKRELADAVCFVACLEHFKKSFSHSRRRRFGVRAEICRCHLAEVVFLCVN